MPTALTEFRKSSQARVSSYEQTASRALSTRAISVGGGGGDGGSGSGGVVSDMGQEIAGTFGSIGSNNKQKLYAHFRNWVYVSVNAIAKRAAGQPWQLAKVLGAEGNPDRKQRWPNTLKASRSSRSYSTAIMSAVQRKSLPKSLRTKAAKQELEAIYQHDLLDVLEQPNGVQGKYEFLYMTICSLLMTGESYWIGGETDDGRIEIWAVPTSWITPKHEGGLFTGYKLQTGESAQGTDLEPEQVVRMYFPDPSNIKASVSPMQTQISAIRVDGSIQSAQEKMFDNGIFPNVVLKVGTSIGPDGSSTGRRPRLTGPQRRQLIAAIRKVWGGVAHYGDPAIIDGLIEGIEKLTNTPAEMDFMQSGEQVKKRIFQAFGVNPFVVGESAPGSYAQAYVVDRLFCDNTVNPLLDNLSSAATRFLGPLFELNVRLLVWVEPCVPSNEEMKQRKWDAARKAGDVTQDEYRAEILNLPPLEEEEPDEAVVEEETQIVVDPAGLSAAVAVATAVAGGTLPRESGVGLLQAFSTLTPEQVDEIVPEEPEEPPPPAPAAGFGPGGGNAPGQQQPATDGEKPPARPKPKPSADEGDEEPPDAVPIGDEETGKGKSATKYNPHHDELGRFDSADTGASGGSGGGRGSAGRDSTTGARVSRARVSRENKTPKTKSEIAKAAAKSLGKPTDKVIQRYSEENNEPILAKGVNGKSLDDNEPADVELHDSNGKLQAGLELKTMVHNKAGKITMSKDAMANKRRYERKNKVPIHTVVFDDTNVYNKNGPGLHDTSQRRIYFRKGYGSYRTKNMHEVTGGMKELKKLLKMKTSDLPEKAR